MTACLRWIIIAMVMAMTGCAAAPQGAAHDEDDGLHPVWPPAGQTPRIVHRRNIHGAAAAAKRSFLDVIAGAVAGAPQQRLLRPQSIAVEPGGERLFIVDQELQGIHVLSTASGKGRFIERTGATTYFVSPVAIAWCDGEIAVSDSSLKQVVMMSPDGKALRTLTKPGGFARPTGVAYDAARGRLYVVDTLASTVCVFDRSGAFLRAIGSPGTLAGHFHYPTYIAVDTNGDLYVTDSLNFRVQIISPDGDYLGDIGKLGNASGHLAVPKGVGVDTFGHVYVVDSYFSTVQIFNREGQLLLSFGDIGDASGQFQVPTGLLVTPENFIYVCDAHNSRVQVFEYVGGPDHE